MAAGGSNRRLSRRAKGQSRVGLTAMSGEDRRKAQGGVRASSAAETSPKAVQRSRDRGCNGHRILRRVPADGRHPGSSRGVSFTRDAHGWSWRSSASSNPCLLAKSWKSRSRCSSREGGRGVRVNERARQGCQRLDRIHTVGRQRPRFMSDAVRRKHEGHVSMTIRRSGRWDVVKRPVPRSRRTEPKTPWGIPAAKVARASREHTRCGHTQFRLGGRNRSDASRVFHTGRSQGLLVSEGR